MTEFGFKIVDKNGNLVEDKIFEDFDSVADYMLDAADKWYSGLQDPDDTMSLQRRENGTVVFEDTSSFGIEDDALRNNGSETGKVVEVDTATGGSHSVFGISLGEDSESIFD
jgi:hypothetical protein